MTVYVLLDRDVKLSIHPEIVGVYDHFPTKEERAHAVNKDAFPEFAMQTTAVESFELKGAV